LDIGYIKTTTFFLRLQPNYYAISKNVFLRINSNLSMIQINKSASQRINSNADDAN